MSKIVKSRQNSRTASVGVDPRVREIFEARLEGIFGASEREQLAALDRAETLVASLPDDLRPWLGVISRGFVRAFPDA